MRREGKWAALTCVILICAAATSAQVPKRDADLAAVDGVKLKVTYYPAGKPGPGILLMHQCNRDRTTWDALATRLAQAGFHVVTMDLRGFGESGGERFGTLDQFGTASLIEKWPSDIDVVFNYLLAQDGVDRTRIGAGGASCSVNNSIQLARRHEEVKTLVLLSGNTDRDGIKFLEDTPRLPLFIAASEDDDDTLPYMRWLGAFSRNPQVKVVSFQAAGHGTEMFKREKGLEPMIAKWYQATLLHPPKPSTMKPRKPSESAFFWDTLIQPGGVAKAQRMFEAARGNDPNASLFPELAVNELGYSRIQSGATREAVDIFKLNVMAYPRSANAYDSLADGYLADHQERLAIEASVKCLQVLAENPPTNPQFAQLIRQSSEQRLKKLRQKQTDRPRALERS